MAYGRTPNLRRPQHDDEQQPCPRYRRRAVVGMRAAHDGRRRTHQPLFRGQYQSREPPAVFLLQSRGAPQRHNPRQEPRSRDLAGRCRSRSLKPDRPRQRALGVRTRTGTSQGGRNLRDAHTIYSTRDNSPTNWSVAVEVRPMVGCLGSCPRWRDAPQSLVCAPQVLGGTAPRPLAWSLGRGTERAALHLRTLY